MIDKRYKLLKEQPEDRAFYQVYRKWNLST